MIGIVLIKYEVTKKMQAESIEVTDSDKLSPHLRQGWERYRVKRLPE
jgi:hypothetical protein